MKQLVILPYDTPHLVTRFIAQWKQIKGYPSPQTLTIGEIIELLIATSSHLHHEESDGRFFNNIMINNESVISWDGDELIDILLYEAIESIKKRY